MPAFKQFQVDAFARRTFEGNPAAVCPLDQWLPDALLQAIAAENNLSETAFFVPSEQGFELRWFTPKAEVALCGHATLAAAHVLYSHLGFSGSHITFSTLSGELRVSQTDDGLLMDFPASTPEPVQAPKALVEGLGVTPQAVLAAEDYVVCVKDETELLQIAPDFSALATLDLRGVIVTAPGDECDFVSRFFAPKLGVDEDPVTGSAHCQLAPYWASLLGKNELVAKQRSLRGGTVGCRVMGERVALIGQAVTFMEAQIYL
ncbi:MAG: PhzF family phenazine biosynthesis protein [Pontibacterium sp.]